MKRFARFWDIFYNSGSFENTVKLLWTLPVIGYSFSVIPCHDTESSTPKWIPYQVRDDVFNSFYAFSEWIYTQTLSTWKISLDRQITLIYDYLILSNEPEVVQKALMDDLSKRPEKTIPFFLRQSTAENKTKSEKSITPKRQAKRI